MRKRLLATALAVMMLAVTPMSVLAGVGEENAPVEEDIVEEVGGGELGTVQADDSTELTQVYDESGEIDDEYVPSTLAADVVDSGTCGDSLTWVLDSEGTLTISGNGEMYDWSATSEAPWFLDRTAITSVDIESGCTSIGARAFYACTYISSIDIPESVSDIGSGAFDECSSLSSIIIPSSVTSLNASVFYNCTRLANISLPEGITTIGNHAFSGCSSLTTINLSDELTSIGTFAFHGCSSLLEISLPQSLISLGTYAFSDCSSLKSIVIPDLITVIDVFTFESCKSLSNVVLPEGLQYIRSMAFYDCSSLENINLPESLTLIDGEAFENCSSLTSIAIPEGVLSIGNYTFSGCTNLSEVSLCKGIVSIDDYAFRNCSNIQTVYYSGNIEDWGIIRIGSGNSYLTNATICCSEAVSISSFIPSLSFTECVYNGDEQKPDVIIEKDSVVLKEDVDYTLTYSNNINVGTAVVTITGINNYEGELVETFVIDKADQELTASADNECIEIGQTSSITTNGQGALYFSSSDKSVAKVDENGIITGVGIGTATILIEASGNENYNSSSTMIEIKVVKVSQEITADIESTSIQYGQTTIITANGIGEIFYESNDESIVNVDNNGVVTGVGIGSTTITVTAEGNDVTESASTTLKITVNKMDQVVTASIESTSIQYGQTTIITADGIGEIFYEPNDDSIVNVDESGVVIGVGIGSTTITVTAEGDDVTESSSITLEITVNKMDQIVTASIESTSIQCGQETFITTDGIGEISYESKDESIVNVDESGVVTGISEGTATIVIKASGDDYYNPAFTTITVIVSTIDLSDCSIALSSTSYTYDGSEQQPTVTVKNGDTTLSEGTDYTVVYSNNINAGTATVTVTGLGDYTGTASKNFTINKSNQTVSASISASSIEVGATATITASGKGTLTYSSGNTSVATVSSSGVVTGKAAGSAIITVKAAGNDNYNSGSATVTIKVTDTTLKKGSSYTVGDFKYKITDLPASGTGMVTITKPVKTSIKTATIPAKMTIGGVSFKVTKIAAKAFKDCKKLTSVTVGKNVTTIGNQAFSRCKKMTKITIKNGVTKFGKKAFYNCKKLKTITIKSKKLKTVGSKAITGINKKATIKVPSGKKKAYKKLFTSKKGFKKTMKIK